MVTGQDKNINLNINEFQKKKEKWWNTKHYFMNQLVTFSDKQNMIQKVKTHIDYSIQARVTA